MTAKSRARTGRAMPPAGVRRRSGVVLSAVAPVARSVAATLGLTVWDVEFRREGGREVLRVAVDRPGAVDAGELTRYSEALSRRLDEADAVPGDSRYTLEVTSPGGERKLRTPQQFGICVGRHLRVTFKDGREPVEGVLTAADDATITIADTTAGYHEISQARLKLPGA